MRNLILSACLSLTVLPALAGQRDSVSYASHRAVILNGNPHLLITEYSYSESSFPNAPGLSMLEILKWKNIGKQDIVAVEMMTLSYDVFNEPIGQQSKIYAGDPASPLNTLAPGKSLETAASNAYRVSGLSFTNVTFPWRLRLADNTIVTPDLEALRKEFAKQLPDISNKGMLEPPRGFGAGADPK